jgi:hypothetical protein
MLPFFPAADVAPLHSVGLSGSAILSTTLHEHITREAEVSRSEDEATNPFEGPLHQQLSHREQVLLLLGHPVAGGALLPDEEFVLRNQ